jgi:hypothetical protein
MLGFNEYDIIGFDKGTFGTYASPIRYWCIIFMVGLTIGLGDNTKAQ